MRKKIKNYAGRNFKKKRASDKLSIKKRSILMSKIRSKNTKFEAKFIDELRKNTRKVFHAHLREIQGTPDIVFKRKKICVFLDSDFWHGWQYPRWKHLLKNDFWRNKIENNRNRDLRNNRHLRKNGWTVLRIWEHEIKKKPSETIQKVKRILFEHTDESR